MRRTIVASLTAAGLCVGFSAAASAADLGSPAPAPVYTKAPIVEPAYNWTGLYLGGNAGRARESASGISDFIDTGVPPSVNPQSNSFSSVGFVGGGQIGYNWQVAPNWVLGAEGDWDWLRTNYKLCRQTDDEVCFDAGRGFESISSQTKWLATARARAGVTVDKFMFYGTGGAAWGSIQSTESLNCLVGGCGTSSGKLASSSSITQTKAGWAAGLGVEGMLARNWSIKAEWLHVDLGHLSNTLTTVGNANSGTQSAVWSRDERFDMLRVGVNYHLGGM
jgi:outer membrane immunogenic protein